MVAWIRTGLPFAAAWPLLCALIVLAPADARAQTHRRWILAEGAANSFFDEEILIGNPNATAANVTITLLPEVFPGESNPPQPVAVPIVVAATSRYTFRVNQVTGIRPGAVAAIVECTNSLDLVVERTMTWAASQRRGAHASQGVLAADDTWYLSEGVTGFFDTFVLITNTNETSSAAVEVRFLLEAGAPVTATYTIPARGRRTVFVNSEFPQIAAPFSVAVRQTDGRADLVVERAMYWNGFEGGHGSTAVTAPSTTWLFAEGTTGANAAFDFQTYLLLANPGATDANVTVTFFRDSGGPVTYTLTGTTAVRGNSRRTLFLDELRFANGIRELASAAFAIRVESDRPILAERAVYWSSNGIVFVEGHNTAGVTAEASKWAFAEGREARFEESGLLSHDSYFLFSNSGSQLLRVKGTFLREDGTGLVRTFVVNPSSRYTLLTSQYPELGNQRFSAFFEAVDGNGQPITTQTFVAERAVYWGDGYFGGHAATGTPWTGTIAAPPAAPTAPVVSSITPSHGALTGGTDVVVRGSNFFEVASLEIGTLGDLTNVVVLNATTITGRTRSAPAAGARDVCVANQPLNVGACLPGDFTYDAPPPTGPLTTVDISLGFGDSITYGTTCRPSPTTGIACDVRTTGYPARLQNLLAARYQSQAITVTGAGEPGECASVAGCNGTPGGRFRLPSTLQPTHDLVVILEGVNDLNVGRSPAAVRDALREMAATAIAQGKQVVICSLTPIVPDGVTGQFKADPAHVAELNSLITLFAAQDGLARVDMVAAFGSNPAQYLSIDGLHPNDAGYQRMAEAIRDKIVERFEVRP
jgi:lysophospholipase L1-like esterase